MLKGECLNDWDGYKFLNDPVLRERFERKNEVILD